MDFRNTIGKVSAGSGLEPLYRFLFFAEHLYPGFFRFAVGFVNAGDAKREVDTYQQGEPTRGSLAPGGEGCDFTQIIVGQVENGFAKIPEPGGMGKPGTALGLMQDFDDSPGRRLPVTATTRIPSSSERSNRAPVCGSVLEFAILSMGS